MAKLFIVGFPRDMEEIELVEMFSIHGIVNTVTIVTDKDSGASKGYGFITMNDDAGAERAISALDGASVDDRTINVRIADEKSAGNHLPVPIQQRLFNAGSIPTTFKPAEASQLKKKRPRLK